MSKENNETLARGKFQGKVLEKLKNIEDSMKMKIDRKEFAPVKAIAYGFVGIVMIAVVSALVAGVVRAIESIIK